MRLLITGGSGLLGSNLSLIAIQRGYDTFVGFNKHKINIGNPIQFNIIDDKILLKVFERVKPEIVVHAAALTDVDKCETEMDLAKKVNIKGTKNIVDLAELHKAFLVYISTDYIFSGKKGMYNEEDEPNPINCYGKTKLEGEKIVKKSDIEWCIVRPSVIYGSMMTQGKVNFALWVLNQLTEGESISLIIDQYVSPTLNTSLSKMILEIMERKLTGIYNLAGATPLTRYEFGIKIADKFQLEKSLIHKAQSDDMEWVAKRPMNTSLNVKKANSILNHKPLDLKSALDLLKEELAHVQDFK